MSDAARATKPRPGPPIEVYDLLAQLVVEVENRRTTPTDKDRTS